MPPGINLILILIGLLLIRKHHRGAISLIIFSSSTLLLLSLPIVSISLLSTIEPADNQSFSEIKTIVSNNKNNTAIVVISAGRLQEAFEYGNIDVVNANTLQRLNYATWLHKKLDIPLLLTGENGENEATPDAVLMNQTLISSFSVVPIWIESKSKNEAEIAKNVSLFLKNKDITMVVLVTHAKEILKTSYVFQKQGIHVIAAPIVFSSNRYNRGDITFYLPAAKSLQDSTTALSEIFTLFWYQLRY